MRKPNILLFTGIAVAFYALLIVYFNSGDMLGAMKKFDTIYILPIAFLLGASYLLKYGRWHFFVRNAGIAVSDKGLFQIYLASLSMLITPGKLGDILKSYLLKKKYGYSKRRTLPAVIMERITDLPSVAILSFAGAYAIYPSTAIILVPFAIVAATIFALRSRVFFCIFLGVFERFSGLRKYKKKISGLYANMQDAASYKNILFGVAAGIAGWAVEGLILYSMIQAVGSSASALLSISIYTISVIAGVISFIPGGLGASEASMFGLLVIAGISKPDALAVTILFRAVTLWFSLAIGSVALSYIERKKVL